MEYLRFIVTLITVTLFSTVDVFGQYLNTNFEHTNKGQQEIKNREDSLLAYSDSLYGIGLSLFHQGKNIEALDYFKQSNSIDSLNYGHSWNYSNGILSSPKSWMSYILYGMGKKVEAQKLIASYDAPHSFNVTAEQLYNAKPFDRRVYTFKLDSLHKSFDEDSTLTTYDKNVAEAELMKNTFGKNHYLYADYLWGLGNECYNPRTALLYLNKAKNIYEHSSLWNILLEGVNESIKDKENVIMSDSLLEEGIKYYRKKKYDKANVCFIRSYNLTPLNSRDASENIRNIDRYEYPLMWLANSYLKGKEINILPYSYCYEDPQLSNYFDVNMMDSIKVNAENNFEHKNYEEAIKYYTALSKKLGNYKDQLIIEILKAGAYLRLGKKDDAETLVSGKIR